MINNILKQYKVWLEFAGLTLVIMLPLLLPGYILTLDLVFAPQAPVPELTSHDFPLKAVIWLFYHVLPGDVVEKIILFSALLLSGVGAYLLIRIMPRPRSVQEGSWRFAAYAAGVLYMINPFIYARFMAGQWMIILGYALLPFFIRSLLVFLRQPSLKHSLMTAGWAVGISIASLHYIGMLLLLAIIFVCVMGSKPRIKAYLKWGSLAVGVWVTASLYWLVPLFVGSSKLPASLSAFDITHFKAFETIGGLASVLQLQGFWVETRQIFVLPQKLMPLWGIWIIVLWAVMLYGGIKMWQHGHKRVVYGGLLCIVVGTIVVVTPLMQWMSSWVPFAAGYREPHKFATMIVIGYSVFFACGTAYIIDTLRRTRQAWKHESMSAGLLLLPVLITPTMFGGFAGQLSPRSYPSEWYQANQLLKADDSVDRVLFLPWHQYATYSFSGRLIANPAEKFFEVPMLISDDPEYKNISPTTPNEEKQQLTRTLEEKSLSPALLRRLHITHIVLAKEQKWEEYKALLPEVLARQIFENDKLIIYKVGKDVTT